MTFKTFITEKEIKTIKIGFVGYSDKKFDKKLAVEYINSALDELIENNNVEIVSGLTDLGIPGLVYAEAVKRKLFTVGIACKKAEEYKCFKCDKTIIIIGDEWGDESEEFLNYIDILVRIGGGKQSLKETKQFKETGKKVIEFDLEETT